MTSGNAAVVPPSPPATPVQNSASGGLTSAEAASRLQKHGPNAMPDTSAHPLAPLSASLVAGEFAAAIIFFLILDLVKIPVFARLGLT